MAKSKKELAQPSTIVKDETLEILENGDDNDDEIEDEIIDSIQAVKPKKKLTEKQIEQGRINLENGRRKKAENDKKKREEAEKIALEEKKLKEERLIKKAISVKKKQIKKQAMLDEISDDDTPIQKIKEIAESKIERKIVVEEVPKRPTIRFV